MSLCLPCLIFLEEMCSRILFVLRESLISLAFATIFFSLRGFSSRPFFLKSVMNYRFSALEAFLIIIVFNRTRKVLLFLKVDVKVTQYISSHVEIKLVLCHGHFRNT